MIALSNRHSFEYMTASGALAYNGEGWLWDLPFRLAKLLDPSRFTNVIKSLTLKPRKGNLRWLNPFGCFRYIPGGTVNAIGLTNPGFDWWCNKIGPHVDSSKIPLVASIFGEPTELVEMALGLNEFDLVGLEINASCPNTRDDVLTNCEKAIESCHLVREVSELPIILKLSVVHDVGKIISEIQRCVEALAINSVPWDIAYPNRKSPLVNLGGGGVSGKAAQLYTWDLVKRLVDLTDIPVIGPSVWNFADITLLRMLGAKAISFGAIFIPSLSRPFAPAYPNAFTSRDQRRREK